MVIQEKKYGYGFSQPVFLTIMSQLSITVFYKFIGKRGLLGPTLTSCVDLKNLYGEQYTLLKATTSLVGMGGARNLKLRGQGPGHRGQ